MNAATAKYLALIQWLCAVDCMVIKDGVPLYRDLDHLSVSGALMLAQAIDIGLFGPVIYGEIRRQ
jgi:hypothetical protein